MGNNQPVVTVSGTPDSGLSANHNIDSQSPGQIVYTDTGDLAIETQ